jgi:signal transduction histidine kinase
MSLGELYHQLNKFSLSMDYFRKAMTRSKELKLQIEEMRIQFSMGILLKAMNKHDDARKAFKETLTFAQQQGDSLLVSRARAELVMIDNAPENNKLEEKTLNENIRISRDKGDRLNMAEGYFKLSEWYASHSEYEKAFANLKQAQVMNDSVRSNAIIVNFKKLEEEYKSEKREKEIALLKKDNELHQQELQRKSQLMIGSVIVTLLALGSIWLLMSRNRLRARMKELELRNMIAADLHDEVGSSLSSIHMLSQMAARPGDEATQKNILEKMSINASETIDKMGDIVWMIKPSDTEAGNLKQRMERFAYEICSSKSIEVQLVLEELNNVKFNMEEKKNIYLIFKEGLNNAVKYSGSEKIEVKASIRNRKLELLIIDFGKGFDGDTVQGGNGLSNMKLRATELTGKLTVETNIDTGTTIRLVVPV